MTKSIVVNAKTVDDAIRDGIAQLGCSISDCKVEILQEGAKGLFGFFGSKPASVRLTLNVEEEDTDDFNVDFSSVLSNGAAAKPVEKPAEKPEEKIATAADTPAVKPVPAVKPASKPVEKPVEKVETVNETPVAEEEKSERDKVYERFHSAPMPCSAEKPERAPRAPRSQRSERAARPQIEKSESDAGRELPEPVPVPEHIEQFDPSTPEGCAQAFLKELTAKMGVEVQIEARREEDGHLFVTMYGDTRGILIGRRGETLDSIQYLTSLQVNKGQDEYIRVTLDTENYRAKREEALRRLANRMAARALKTGRKVALEPMNPYERRILHATLQNNANVSTHSEGDEPYRHVVIVPKPAREEA